MVRYTLEQRVFLYDTHVKYKSARKRRRNFWRKFRYETVPSRKIIHNFMNKLRTTGPLIDKKQKHKRRVLTEEKLGDTGARLEHTPRKLLKRLAQETGVSKSSARKIVVHVFFNERINCEKYLREERTIFSTPPFICEL
jgi:hypothetical protein